MLFATLRQPVKCSSVANARETKNAKERKLKMKKITNDDVLNILDCWMNPNSEVPCKSCPLHNKVPAGNCRYAALDIIRERIIKLAEPMSGIGLEEYRLKTISRFADRVIMNLSSVLDGESLASAEICIANLVHNEENGL